MGTRCRDFTPSSPPDLNQENRQVFNEDSLLKVRHRVCEEPQSSSSSVNHSFEDQTPEVSFRRLIHIGLYSLKRSLGFLGPPKTSKDPSKDLIGSSRTSEG